MIIFRAIDLTVRRGMAAALCAVATLASPVVAEGMGIASQDEILAGIRSCTNGVGPAGLDEAHLIADGWSKGSMSSKDGKPVENGLIVYGKGHLMVLTSNAGLGQMQLCNFVAKIASVQAFPKLQAAMASTYGVPFKDNGRGDQYYRASNSHLINLVFTGSNDRPSVRVAVGYVSQESK